MTSTSSTGSDAGRSGLRQEFFSRMGDRRAADGSCRDLVHGGEIAGLVRYDQTADPRPRWRDHGSDGNGAKLRGQPSFVVELYADRSRRSLTTLVSAIRVPSHNNSRNTSAGHRLSFASNIKVKRESNSIMTEEWKWRCCPNCSERHDDRFEVCWKFGSVEAWYDRWRRAS